MNIAQPIFPLVRIACVLSLIASAGFAQNIATPMLGQGRSWQTPYYVVDSGVDGPTVVITGGIHGNEPAGARSAEQIRHWPIVRGKLIVVPQVNTAGLQANKRFIPGAPEEQQDLNRNFPSPGIADEPRGEIATELWKFVVAQNPDWFFDLHEGFDFNISHEPKPGNEKSVGSSIIYDRNQDLDVLVERMLAAANANVTDDDRRFVSKGRGPKKTTLAGAVIDVLDRKAMILETTWQHQRLPVRTRQHRKMMNVALNQLGMIVSDCSPVVAAPVDKRHGHIFVALYDDEGGSDAGVANLTKVFDAAPDMTVVHLGADDIREEVLSQFDVVVFGGGSGSVEAKTIGKEGAEAVRAFVRNGGGYVGVCAGAYLCSAHYTWSLNLIDTHVLTGKREVEGSGPKSMWYRGGSSCQQMELTTEGRQLFSGISPNVDVRYQNGPIVSPKNFPGLKPYQVLAYFRSEQVLHPPQKGTMIDTPAIVSGEFGKGRVISISPHPEATEGLESMLATAVTAVAPQREP
ncbi:MAG: succinylglutamate desuccinylase/aspartoacylase family protein [Planctomycetaceae bacterium]|nr:succinylglutamate desuccinylase/aspartoacylase family protein [Planctomycetaceae bacterium]